ncbi:sulfatase family protein [Horticoccus sp. 23ND18S-11]|uniref:sulfatase family protein n=1 Tax=Horticoccus sp. 23ND18S-11 TaxID=3391832 RepID=UPI0039C8D8FD
MPRLAPLALLLVLALHPFAFAAEPTAPRRPNILWITCEDTSPLLGCYGDAFAVTPQLDAFARESVRYTDAYAYTGACSPSRSCLITGVYPLRLGTHQMRSTIMLPPSITGFPAYLRAAGYYTSNNEKTDYNFEASPEVWNESSKVAHWRKRAPGQPFFSVFNFMVTHQSQIFASDAVYRKNTARLTPDQRRDPAKVPVPPIHPDTPEFRREWARHYENVTAMDYQVGDLLADLARDGLADDTIVFFFSDHGTGMPAIKMWAGGPSLRVPLLVRFPKKWAHLAPGRPGSTTDRLVSFVDFAPTVLSLAGVRAPAHFQGTAFLGAATGPARTFIFAAKDRQSEMSETIRAVRDGRFHYIRNFRPHLPYGQFMSYNWQHASLQSWERLHLAGQLSGPPARFFAPHKPREELYDVHGDPWQVRNLAANPALAGDLVRLRSLLVNQMRASHDLGLLPEHELHRRAAGSTPYAIATDPRLNPLDTLLRAADLANAMDASNIPALSALLHDTDAAVRWWGATGLFALGTAAAPATPALVAALDDTSPDVRLAAAEALARLGEVDRALRTVEAALRLDDVFVRLAALNVALRLGPLARPLLPAIAAARITSLAQKDSADYANRMVDYLPARLAR